VKRTVNLSVGRKSLVTRFSTCVRAKPLAYNMHKYIPQSIKDARRRSVESFMGAMGSTDRTYDAEFESHCKHFKALYEDMNECKWNDTS
jgi:hypothetical protein